MLSHSHDKSTHGSSKPELIDTGVMDGMYKWFHAYCLLSLIKDPPCCSPPLVRAQPGCLPRRTLCVCVAHHVCVSVGCIHQPRACPSERTVSVSFVWCTKRGLWACLVCPLHALTPVLLCPFRLYKSFCSCLCGGLERYYFGSCARVSNGDSPFVLVCVQACVWPKRVASSVQPAFYYLLLGVTHKRLVSVVDRLFCLAVWRVLASVRPIASLPIRLFFRR
jgi:hypothetical protein